MSTVDITDNIFPSIICGNIYDPVLENVSGHCMVAFTKDRIGSISDLSKLNRAYIIEPQDGSFHGNINEANSGVYLLNKDIWSDRSAISYISAVITDNDFYLFSEDSLTWGSYKSFDSLLKQEEKQISAALD